MVHDLRRKIRLACLQEYRSDQSSATSIALPVTSSELDTSSKGGAQASGRACQGNDRCEDQVLEVTIPLHCSLMSLLNYSPKGCLQISGKVEFCTQSAID